MNPLSQASRQKVAKSISDIVNHHIKHNSLDVTHDDVVFALSNAIKQGFKIIQFNNVLFAVKPQDGGVLFSIINGDNSIGYVKAIRQFVSTLKNNGIHKFMIYVQDIDSATKLGTSAGLKNINFKESNKGNIDPFLMIGEA